MGVYLRPPRLEEALSALARPHPVLAGGPDFYPARVGRAIDEDVLDIGGIDVLRGITAGPAGWRLGAPPTWTQLFKADLPPLFDRLKEGARRVPKRRSPPPRTVACRSANSLPACAARCWRRASWWWRSTSRDLGMMRK